MKRITTLLLMVLGGCFDSSSGGDDIVDPPSPPAACSSDIRDTKLVTVSGSVVDFATLEPIAGATVDIGTAWDGTEDACPVIATVTTRADGTFGPSVVAAGSTSNPTFIIFRVHGAGRALTTSDNRTCTEARCNLSHTIAAPSLGLAAAWRAELAEGGMANADTRGLVAFEFISATGDASGVVPNLLVAASSTPTRDLVPGSEVRFVDADRSAIMPLAQTATSASGLALVAGDSEAIYIGGTRGAEDNWFSTGCLVEDGAIFLEDRAQAP